MHIGRNAESSREGVHVHFGVVREHARKSRGEWKIKHRIVHVDNGANFIDGELAVHMKSFMEWMAENGTVA